MSFRQFAAVALISLALCGTTVAQSSEETLPEFNQAVLDLIETYPADGTHGYWWGGGYDGCSQDIYLLGEKVMDGEPEQRTYCCGLTLEVFARVYDQWVQGHGSSQEATLTAGNWQEFQRLWFVPAVNASGPSAALEAFGLGREISRSEVLPGDFVQIWRRQGSGHSVIFMDWVIDEATGEITGFKYWSTQPGTNGISLNTESFAPPEAERGVADEFTFWGRVEIPAPEVTVAEGMAAE